MSKLISRDFAIAASATVMLTFSFGSMANAQAEGGDLAPTLYEECGGCHNLTTNDVGPQHCGVFGRPAASVPGFSYSAAMQESGIVWDEEHLDEFLKSPFTYVSGTMMGYFGIHDDAQRAEMIAFLKTLTPDSPLCSGAE